MQALTFGVSCAPCIGNYVRDTNAEEFKLQFPRAVDLIRNHHYVDDLIDSEETEEAAATLAKELQKSTPPLASIYETCLLTLPMF